MPDNTGVRKIAHVTNARAIDELSQAISDAARRHGKDRLAKAADVTTRTIEKWMAGNSLPSLDYILNLSDVEPQILRCAVALKAWNLTPQRADAANDMELAAGLGHGLSELIDRLRDGRLCHIDKAVLAQLFRELIPAMQAIVDEDAALRAA